METLKKNVANLIKVKTLVTLLVLTVFVILSLRGDIPADSVMIIVTSVVSFYFGTQHEKNPREPVQTVYVGPQESTENGVTVSGFADAANKE